MTTVKKYLSLIKFSHTIFAMPFALIGFMLGAAEYVKIWFTSFYRDYYPSSWSVYNTEKTSPLWLTFVLVIGCMIFARSAAMAFNRYLDRKFDAKNPRTAIREIPSGIINEKNALTFVIINCVLFVVTTFFINSICFYY
jgi:4-hydroxybenzoate polyprenyltransferase